MWLHLYGIVNSCLLFKGTDQIAHLYLAANMMNETVAFSSLFHVGVTLVDTSLFQTTSLFEPIFFGIIKHLLDLTSSNIQLIAPVQNNIGLSFASPNITLSRCNKQGCWTRSRPISVYYITSVIPVKLNISE